MVVWLIGLSGAGKTTISRILVDKLREKHSNVVFLDGDILRDVWGDKLGHDLESRRINAHRISQLSMMLDKQGIHVVTAILSLFPDWQAWNRKNIYKYYEVFLDVPIDILIARDTKGLYKKAIAGDMDNVAGIDLEFPVPPNPDLILKGEILRKPPEESANQIYSLISKMI